MFIQFEQYSRKKQDLETHTEPLEQWLRTQIGGGGGIEKEIQRICAVLAIMATEFLKSYPEKFDDILFQLNVEDGVRHRLVEHE